MAWIQAGFFSETLGMSVQCNVILPVREEENKAAKRPVLWLLHGARGNCDDWIRYTSIERYATARGLAVVMPSAHMSSYMNMAHGGRFYDYIAKELPRRMRVYFPLSDKRKENFIAGLSMGGRGALMIGLANPRKYARIGCLSAGFDIPDNASYQDAVIDAGKPLPAYADTRNNARNILESRMPRPVIYHAVGSNDDSFLPVAREVRAFFEDMEGNPFRYVYEESPGSHDWAFWDKAIERFISLLPLKDDGADWR